MRVTEIINPQHSLRILLPLLSQCRLMELRIVDVIGLGIVLSVVSILIFLILLVQHRPQPRDNPVNLPIELGALLRHPRDNQRGTSLINEDAVYLVNNGVVHIRQHQVLGVGGHIVAQIVEAQLAVLDVDNILGVIGLPLGRSHALLDISATHAQEFIYPPHPVGLPAHQVIVSGNKLDAATGQRIEVKRHSGGQRLALAGLHLGDLALVQDNSAHHLHVKVALAQCTLGGLAHRSKGLGENIVEGFPAGQARSEFLSLGAELFLAETLELRLQLVDLLDAAPQSSHFALVGIKNLF